MALVALALLVPLSAAGLLALTRPLANRIVADAVALVAATAVFILCAILASRASHHEVVYWFGGWKPDHGVALGISFAFGALGAGCAAFCAALTVAALTFSWRVMEVEGHLFHVILLVFLAAMVGFCLSGDLFNMFVFFELMGVAAYVLTGFMIDHRAPLAGALNFAVTNSIGGVVLLLGIALLYGHTGALNLAQIGVALDHRPIDTLEVVAFTLIVCGFMVKAAILPFHFWLPDAYAVAPTPVCILFAGALSELGLFGIARVYWTIFHGALGPHDAAIRAVLVGAGVLTAVLGASLALLQQHLKRLLAFATIAYIGLFLIGIGLLTPAGLAGSAAYIVGDGFVKASLFVSVGIIDQQLGSLDIDELRGRGRHLPFTAVLFLIGGVAVAGLPPFGPFLGHALIEDAALREPGYAWLPTVMLIISALAGAAILRAGGLVFRGLGPQTPRHRNGPDTRKSTASGEPAESHRTPILLTVPAAMLLLAGLAWGLVPNLSHALLSAASDFTAHTGYEHAVLGGSTRPEPSPVAGGGPSTGSYFYAAGAVLAAIAVAGASFSRRPRARLTVLIRPLNLVRTLHSGRMTDYVAWLSTGVALFGAAFTLGLH